MNYKFTKIQNIINISKNLAADCPYFYRGFQQLRRFIVSYKV